MRVTGRRLSLLALPFLAAVCEPAERMASAKLKNAEPEKHPAAVEAPAKPPARKDAKRTAWPPKLGVKTPGVQIPMASLKAEASIALNGSTAGILAADTVFVATRDKDQLLPITAKTNKTEEAIPGVEQPCATMVSAFGSIWAPDCKSQTIARIDAKTKKITASVSVGVVEGLQTVAASSDSVWVISDEKTTLTRIDPEQNKIVAETRLPAACSAILSAENALWVACPKADKVLRLDPATNLVKKYIDVSGQPAALTFGEGTIWALTRTEGKVVRIDPKTEKVTATIELKTPAPTGALVFSEGFTWVSIPGFPIARIDPTSDKVAQQFAGEGGGSIYAGAGSLWIPGLEPKTLSRFDPKRIKATLAE